MVKCLKEHYSSYDGFVITHGTDTMAYTAAALSYMVQNSMKPIVITGSQRPLASVDSDARSNLLNAIVFACDEHAHGVHILLTTRLYSERVQERRTPRALTPLRALIFRR